MLGKNTLVAFGDSNVWGAELKDVPTRQPDFKTSVYKANEIENWPYHIRHSFTGIIAENNSMDILNLAIPGCSNDTIFRRINQFAQGRYPVNFSDCFVMIFWTSVVRREFFRPDINKYLNYSPAWESDLQLFPKFHKQYVKTVLHEEYDTKKTLNYIYSTNALLKYNKVSFVQGYSLQDKQLAKIVEEHNLTEFLSHDPFDGISPSVVIKGGGLTNNPYIFTGHHPTELGHKFLAEKYTSLIDKIYKR